MPINTPIPGFIRIFLTLFVFFLYLCSTQILKIDMAKKVLSSIKKLLRTFLKRICQSWDVTLPQKAQEAGLEIRTFMPKWGNINERRGQLHEVIRLSGMNLIIDDTDHPSDYQGSVYPTIKNSGLFYR